MWGGRQNRRLRGLGFRIRSGKTMGQGVLVGDSGCGGSRARPLGTGSGSGMTVVGIGDFGWLSGRWPIRAAPSRHTFTTVSVSPAARVFM